MLSAASVTISAVNDIDDYINSFGGEFDHADSYRGAAGWLLFVGLAAVIYHGITIIFRIVYFTAKIGHTFAGYSFAVSDYRCHRLKMHSCMYTHAH